MVKPNMLAAASGLEPDIKTRLLAWLLKIVKFFRPTMSVVGFRRFVDRREANLVLRLPSTIEVHEQQYAEVNCSYLNNSNSPADIVDKKIVLHLHGGAMCIRMPKVEMNYIGPFCHAIGADAILPWYSLAPEAQYPAGLNDCLAVYQQLLTMGYQPNNILLSGLSAGGGYCLALLAQLKQQNIAMPRCCVLLSASGDSLMVGDSWVENSRKDPLFTVADVLYFQNLSVPPAFVADVGLNVSLMDGFEMYPPMYLTASTDELLRDVSTMAAKKAELAGIPYQLDLYQGGLHGIHSMLFARQAKEGWRRILAFVAEHGFPHFYPE